MSSCSYTLYEQFVIGLSLHAMSLSSSLNISAKIKLLSQYFAYFLYENKIIKTKW